MPGPTDLRARILASLSLPATLVLAAACGERTAPEVPLTPSPTAGSGPDAGATATAPATDEGKACGTDQVLESVCGTAEGVGPQAYPYEACPAEMSKLRRVTATVRLPIDRGHDEAPTPEPSTAGFTFDAAGTEDAVKRLLGKSAASYDRAGSKSALCCYTRCASIEVAMAGDARPSGGAVARQCIPSPRATRMPSSSPPCPAAVRLHGRFASFGGRSGELCCYDVVSDCEPGTHRMPDGSCRHYYRGRPIREGGAPVVAATRDGATWARAASAEGLAPPEVAEAWARAAATEHASVASFARLALDLLALGAPSDLVRACHVAGLDEIDHAERSYGLASRFAGRALGPGPLPLTGATRRADLLAVLVETFVDGCVGETVAALEAEEARAHAMDDDVRATLDVVARDEASHAALAFRLVAWALATGGPDARDALAYQLEAVAREAEAARPVCGESPLGRWGVIDEATLAAVRCKALREVVLPCSHALLESARLRVGTMAALVS